MDFESVHVFKVGMPVYLLMFYNCEVNINWPTSINSKEKCDPRQKCSIESCDLTFIWLVLHEKRN